MFSHNGLISEKQMRCMMMLYVFAGSIFILPHLFARMYGYNILTGIIMFCIMAAVYIGIIFRIGMKCPNEAAGWYEKVNKDILRLHETGNLHEKKSYIHLLVVVNLIRYMVRLSFYILLSVAILSEGQVPFVDRERGSSIGNLLVLVPLLMVAFYGSDRSLEKQGRINEMIFLAAFFPYVIMIIFGVKEIDWSFLKLSGLVSDAAQGNMSVYRMLLYSYGLLTFVTPVEIYPRLKLNMDNNKGSNIRIYMSVMAMVILTGVLSLLMAGIYGVNGIGHESMASIAIMRYIELPLGVLQRFDVLMVWFFMTGCFAFFCSTLFYIRNELFKVVSEKACRIVLAVILLAAYVIAVMIPEYKDILGAFVVYGAVIDIPMSIILLLYEKYFGARKVKTTVTVLKAGMLFVLCIVVFVWLSGSISYQEKGNTMQDHNSFSTGNITENRSAQDDGSVRGVSYNIENVEQRDYATILIMDTTPTDYKEGINSSKQFSSNLSFINQFDTNLYGTKYYDVAQISKKNSITSQKYHYVLGIAGEHRMGEKNEPENVFEADAVGLDELSIIYGERKGKALSLSHLKVIVAAVDNTAQNKEEMYESIYRFLSELDGQDEVAKTCPFLFTIDADMVADYIYNAESPVGTYISDIVKIEMSRDRKIPKLMDYLKAVREGEDIDIYFLEKEKNDLKLVPAGDQTPAGD